jgi:hypothetical protein
VWALWTAGMVSLFWFVKGNGCLEVYEGLCAFMFPVDVIALLEL